MTEHADPAVNPPTLSAGTLLRQARVAQGLHIAVLAAQIKVAPRKLEALEADRFDALLDATFARALAQAVCRQLRIDAEPVLSRLPQPKSQRLEHVSRGLDTPFRDRPGRPTGDEPSLHHAPGGLGAGTDPARRAGVVSAAGAMDQPLEPSGNTGQRTVCAAGGDADDGTMMSDAPRPIAPSLPAARRTRQARVAWRDRVVTIGGDAPVRVQSMTNTDTVDVIETAIQVKELAQAGSELVRITVNTPRGSAGRAGDP